jgi:predicted RNase H-like HicB family nuclease
MASKYQVELTRDEDGWWLASVPRVSGAHSQGRSIEQALHRVREALGLWVTDADDADLEPRIHVSLAVRRDIDRALGARRRAELASEEASAILVDVIDGLTSTQSMSVRDIAALLSVSPARINQLQQRTRSGSKKATSKRR